MNPPPLPLRHPALGLAALIAAACLVVSASYLLYDTDLWTFLGGGKAIWASHAVPRTDLWTWRHYGEPVVLSSWLFRAILWPVWSAGGVWGLYVLRWATVLVAFALLWSIARAMGARGVLALLVMVWAGLVYRQRTDLGPEILAAVLLVLQLWILETRRHGGADRTWWIVPLVWMWANTHISYPLAFVLIGIYLADAVWRGRQASGTARVARRLLLVAAASAAAAFVNPFGWRLLAEPFEFALFWRDDPLFKTILELRPVVWSANLHNGLPLMMLLWPALIVARIRRNGVDVAELLCCAFFTAIGIGSWRFVTIYALVAAPFLARDLEGFVSASRWQLVPRRPWAGAAAVAIASVAISLPEWSRPALPLGIGIDPVCAPVRACDFIADHGLEGRGFNESHLGGYQAFRFSPVRERLPFIGAQPEYATPEDRRLYIASYVDVDAWRELQARYRFDYLMLARDQSTGSRLLDFIDQDSSWTMVFTDDVAQVFVRREGPFAEIAREFGYRVLPAGVVRRESLVPACAASPELRARAIAELKRAAASSTLNGASHHMLGVLALIEGRFDDGRAHLERAIHLKPRLPRVHELLGRIALQEGRTHDAIHEFAMERALHPDTPEINLRLGQAYALLGDARRARDFYRRELERDPANAAARDSLRSGFP